MQQRHSRSRCFREDSRVMEALKVRATLFLRLPVTRLTDSTSTFALERRSGRTLKNLLIATHKAHKETSVTAFMTRAYQARAC